MAHGAYQPSTGVTDGGGACIAHVRQAFPLAKPGDHVLGGFGFVVLVHRQKLRARAIQAIGPEQLLGVAGVLAGNGIHLRQDVQGTQADVGEVANGGRHDIQCADRVVLRSGSFVRGLKGFAE